MENELISIVVPIYNVENYLRMCLDSIQNQTYQNFECLLINDGSPDYSSKICEEFVEKDSRFKYFEKANGGLSSARNLGIECSGGAYITFVDSDDWLEHDALDRLYGALKKENADISIGRYNSYDETRYVYMTYVTDPDDSLEVIEGKAIMDREGVEEVRNGNWTVAVLKLFKRVTTRFTISYRKNCRGYLLDMEGTSKSFEDSLFESLCLLVPCWFI